MAEVKFSKGSEEWMMFTDFWQLCQKHWKVEKADDYWRKLTKDADSFFLKYKHIILAKELTLAFLQAQEKKYKFGE